MQGTEIHLLINDVLYTYMNTIKVCKNNQKRFDEVMWVETEEN